MPAFLGGLAVTVNNAREIWQAKLDVAIEKFQNGEISDDVFKACLYSAGFRGQRLRDEFDYWKSQLGLPW